MRLSALIGICLACAIAEPAIAGTRATVTVKTYPVSGDSGQALVDAINRNGPRQGFLLRAIAQTRYSVDWQLTWGRRGKACRLQRAEPYLSIDYRYPALAHKVSPALKRRWAAFLAGVRRHEEMHGRLATEMVDAAQRSIRRVAFANDPSCRRVKQEVASRITRTYATYEARQIRFDDVEHREGGNVDRLLASLIGQK